MLDSRVGRKRPANQEQRARLRDHTERQRLPKAKDAALRRSRAPSQLARMSTLQLMKTGRVQEWSPLSGPQQGKFRKIYR